MTLRVVEQELSCQEAYLVGLHTGPEVICLNKEEPHEPRECAVLIIDVLCGGLVAMEVVSILCRLLISESTMH